jgi:predicted O-methyltransferase YrrM
MDAAMRDSAVLREPAMLAAIWQSTRSLGFSMASEPLTGSLLRALAASKPAASFLELGSGTGLSTAWLLDGMDAQSQLLTMDNDEAVLRVLREHLGADARLKVVCADGDDFVHSLHGQQFDFIFADTWAGKYRLLDEALAMLRPGGIYVIDDMLEQPNWPDGHAQKAAALIAYLGWRDDLTITTLSWASGLLIAVKG